MSDMPDRPVYTTDLFHVLKDITRMILRKKLLDNWCEAGEHLMKFCELVSEAE